MGRVIVPGLAASATPATPELPALLRPPLTWNAASGFADVVPGIGMRLAQDILAETGIDMTRFPSAGHFASWAKICPGHNESAGKRFSGATGHGNRWLRAKLVQAAWAAVKVRDSYAVARLPIPRNQRVDSWYSYLFKYLTSVRSRYDTPR